MSDHRFAFLSTQKIRRIVCRGEKFEIGAEYSLAAMRQTIRLIFWVDKNVNL